MQIRFKLLFSACLVAFQLQADSVWTSSMQHSLFADVRARNKGDIVVLDFTATESSAGAGEGKSISATIEERLGKDSVANKKYPFVKKALNRVFRSLTTPYSAPSASYPGTQIAMQVMDVLPNGNLVLEGVRKYKFWDTYKFEVLRGIVRSSDIDYNNSIKANKVSRLTIDYATGNSFEDAKRNGLITNLNNLLDPY